MIDKSVAEKDWELLKILIENPDLTNSQIAEMLGISRQAVSRRRKRLKERGILRHYVYLDLIPRIDLTKKFMIKLREIDYDKVREVIRFLQQNWQVVLFWGTKNDRIEGIMIDRTNSFKKLLLNEFSFIETITITEVRLQKIFGEKISIENEEDLMKIGISEAKRILKKGGIKAILLILKPEEKVVILTVIKDKKIWGDKGEFIEKQVKGETYVQIRYTTIKYFKQLLKSRIRRRMYKKAKILYVRDQYENRRIKRMLRIVKHI